MVGKAQRSVGALTKAKYLRCYQLHVIATILIIKIVVYKLGHLYPGCQSKS